MSLITTHTLLSKQNLVALIIAIFIINFPKPSIAEPKETVATDIKNCRYLKDVDGESGYGKNNNWKIIAKYFAIKKAEEIGASHIVWHKIYYVGAFNGIITAKAYQCKS